MSRSARIVALTFVALVAAALLGLGLRTRSRHAREDEQRQCDLGDANACATRCAGGSRTACLRLGELRSLSGDLAGAVLPLRAACDADEARACLASGRLSELGQGQPKAPDEASRSYRKACDAGVADACGWLGFLHRRGEGVAKDDVASRALLDKACDAGLAEACSELATMLEHSEGGDANPTRAALLHARACRGHAGRSCGWLASRQDEDSRSEGIRAVYLRRACDGDDLDACLDLADRRYSDPVFAGRQWQRACDAGRDEGCRSLAHALLQGTRLARDPMRAAKLLQGLCDGGGRLDCLDLANLVASGDGANREPLRAEELAKRACADATQAEGAWRCPGLVRPPHIRYGQTTRNSRLAPELVDATVQRMSTHVRMCWEGRHLPVRLGSLRVRLVVSPSGAVVSATATDVQDVDVATADCVLDVLRDVDFPPPSGGSITLNVPFKLVDYGGP